MKPIPAIVEKLAVSARDIDLARERIIVEIAGERDDLRIAERHEHQAAAARESAKARRLRIGAQLAKVRPAWPERGPNAKGWGEFLREVGISEDSALRYIAESRGEVFPQNEKLRENSSPEPVEDRAERSTAPAAPPQLALVPEPETSVEPEVEIDRDTWCTPPWLTAPLGRFHLDPCSNERSTVEAERAFNLEQRGEDGLGRALAVAVDRRVFINPPYSDVGPWIAAYKHTRFCFLLKLDTSTKWFAELHAATALILIPRRRVNFIPPPGVPKEHAVAQQFPHALFYAHAEDATDAIRAMCWSWRVDR